MNEEKKTLSRKGNSSSLALELTITLDSSDDIIECSVLGENKNCLLEKGNGVLKTPNKVYMPKTPDHTKKLEDDISNLRSTNKRSRSSLRKSCKSENDQTIGKKGELFETSCPKDPNHIIKKLISTFKKTPDGPYLSKSKLKNVEQWLNENSVEYIKTPPFANLSVTPVSSSKRGLFYGWKNSKKKLEESSIDSDVEGVLKAVYGEDWNRKDVQRRARTEPKQKAGRFFLPTTLKKKKETGGFYSARRNILGEKMNLVDESDCENNLNDSLLSGVRIINFDSSSSSLENIRSNILTSFQKKGKCEDNKIRRSISLDSLSPSPPKKKKSRPVLLHKPKNQSSTTSARKKCAPEITPKTQKKTFLASLSISTPTSRCHPDAEYYKINFKSKKEELVKKLYNLFNREVFDGKLADDLSFSWNVKLRGTAGYCYNKRVTKSTGEVLRLCKIEFSKKIVDRADRLRDTMIHELCHAGSWVIDGVSDGHGRVWSKWASRAMERFPELPKIKRCHNYDIVSKYVYRCTRCGYSVKRHSKSINTEKKRCGHCYGILELLINKKRKDKGEVPVFDTTRTLPTPNKFAMFVKENYHSVKSTNTNAKHSEIMKILSQQYALFKNNSKSAKISDNE